MQILPRPTQLALGRIQIDSQLLGNLFVLVPFDYIHVEHHSISFGQLRNGSRQFFSSEIQFLERFQVCRGCMDLIHIELKSVFLVPAVVRNRGVDNDSPQPTFETVVFAERLDVAEHLDPRLLQNVFRIGPTVRVPERHGKHHGAEARVHLPLRAGLAPLARFNEVDVSRFHESGGK